MKHNSLTLLLAATMMLLAGVQTAEAQKVVLHKTNGQTIECDVSELDSITFEREADDSGENNKYCQFPARLTIENVQQAPVLFTACESMGEYCTITSDGQKFLFTDALNHTSVINIITIDVYSGYYLGLSGFIVGTPTIPEEGEDNVHVVCFDRACSNCYQNYSITKPLLLQTNGYAKCNTCGRTYNLNNVGNVSDGPSGRPLYRYRVSYLGQTLLIYNE